MAQDAGTGERGGERGGGEGSGGDGGGGEGEGGGGEGGSGGSEGGEEQSLTPLMLLVSNTSPPSIRRSPPCRRNGASF